mgnify:CR=1 FL=1
MSRKIVSIVLPVLTFLALSGTGFGVWVFNSENNTTV